MNYQTYIVDATRLAGAEFFRYAKAVPAEKLDWTPDGGRSVLALAREMAMCPGWGADVVAGEQPEFSEETIAAIEAEQAQWTTVEACEAEFARRMETFSTACQAVSDERLEEKRWLPYEGGRDFTIREMMDYPRWNANYHTGQVAYLQTMYGDKEMY